MTKYFVLNENTLGYIDPIGRFDPLAGSVLKGGLDWKNGPISYFSMDDMRPATLQDFEDYRVCAKGHLT
jgi:hypothetical protein